MAFIDRFLPFLPNSYHVLPFHYKGKLKFSNPSSALVSIIVFGILFLFGLHLLFLVGTVLKVEQSELVLRSNTEIQMQKKVNVGNTLNYTDQPFIIKLDIDYILVLKTPQLCTDFTMS